MDILKPVIFSRYSPRADGSVALTFETQELPPAEVAVLHALRNNMGVLGFSRKDTLTKQEIKDITSIDVDLEGKTKSERLRNVLFRLWEQQPNGCSEFKQFYEQKMEALIQQIRTRLEP
jgi:hypothetical protein